MTLSKELASTVKLLPKQYKRVLKALKDIKHISLPASIAFVFPEEVKEMSYILDDNNRSIYKGGYYYFLRESERLEKFVEGVLNDPDNPAYEGNLMLALIAIFTVNMVVNVMYQAYKQAEPEGDPDKIRQSFELTTQEIGLVRDVFKKSTKDLSAYVFKDYTSLPKDPFSVDDLRRMRLALIKMYGLKFE